MKMLIERRKVESVLSSQLEPEKKRRMTIPIGTFEAVRRRISEDEYFEITNGDTANILWMMKQKGERGSEFVQEIRNILKKFSFLNVEAARKKLSILHTEEEMRKKIDELLSLSREEISRITFQHKTGDKILLSSRDYRSAPWVNEEILDIMISYDGVWIPAPEEWLVKQIRFKNIKKKESITGEITYLLPDGRIHEETEEERKKRYSFHGDKRFRNAPWSSLGNVVNILEDGKAISDSKIGHLKVGYKLADNSVREETDIERRGREQFGKVKTITIREYRTAPWIDEDMKIFILKTYLSQIAG